MVAETVSDKLPTRCQTKGYLPSTITEKKLLKMYLIVSYTMKCEVKTITRNNGQMNECSFQLTDGLLIIRGKFWLSYCVKRADVNRHRVWAKRSLKKFFSGTRLCRAAQYRVLCRTRALVMTCSVV